MLRNPNPPKSRNPNFGFRVVQVPLVGTVDQAGALQYWKTFYADYRAILENPDVRTLIFDGDSDSWELQRFAEFGRLAKVPGHLYDGVNAARRAMYARAHDSGKNVIATNKLKKHYVLDMDPATGRPKVDASGNDKRVWDGTYERQGFNDQEYLWHVQVRNFYVPEKEEWGIKIIKCKANRALEGMDLIGEDCNFAGLVQTCYPNIELSAWGL